MSFILVVLLSFLTPNNDLKVSSHRRNEQLAKPEQRAQARINLCLRKRWLQR